MKLNQVLVVYKQVSTSPHGRQGSRDARVAEGNTMHLATLNELYEVLKEFGISFEARSIRQLKNVGDVDLVITVGGDGTVLAASHFVERQPILGVKSFGRLSVGYFCAATRQTFKRYLISLMKGSRRPIKLHRLEVTINGRRVAERALNDVLFAHALPASTSRYQLSIGRVCEEQKSSGVWVSTAAGSTAAVRAAGGRTLSLESNKTVYFVREPYLTSGCYRLKSGILSSEKTVKIISEMAQGTVFIDGGATQYPAPIGSKIVISGAKRPLMVYWR